MSKERPKRKAACSNDNSAATISTKRQKNSRELSAYFKSYKSGLGDWHLALFKAIHGHIVKKSARVLYPGSFNHITPSLVFEDVVYIDSDPKMKKFFDDKIVKDWIEDNKHYTGNTCIEFECLNFNSLNKKFEDESFDLLISACAGFVTPTTSSLLKKGGYYLVSDAHFDARMLSLDATFTLVAVWDETEKKLDSDRDLLTQHFVTKDGRHITRAMVDESAVKPKAKRSFKLKREAMFYLFTKNK